MELGKLFDEELRSKGAWLPFGPAPEWAMAANLIEKRIDAVEDELSAKVLRAQKEAIDDHLANCAKVRVRFLPFDLFLRIQSHPASTRKVSLALAAVTGWEGLTSDGGKVEFDAKSLEAVAVSNDSFLDFVMRTCRNLPLLTAWRDREVKKN